MDVFDFLKSETDRKDTLTVRVPKHAPEKPLSKLKVSGVKRDSLGRVMKGSPSPNPKGGPAAQLARQIMAATDSLETVVDLMVGVAHGELEIEVLTPLGTIETVGPSVKERMEAAKWLADRAAGKAADVIKIETDGAERAANRIDPTLLRPQELADLLDLTALVLDRQANQVVEGEVTSVLAAQAGNTHSESEE